MKRNEVPFLHMNMDTLQMIQKLHRWVGEEKQKISHFDWKNKLNDNHQMENYFYKVIFTNMAVHSSWKVDNHLM